MSRVNVNSVFVLNVFVSASIRNKQYSIALLCAKVSAGSRDSQYPALRPVLLPAQRWWSPIGGQQVGCTAGPAAARSAESSHRGCTTPMFTCLFCLALIAPADLNQRLSLACMQRLANAPFVRPAWRKSLFRGLGARCKRQVWDHYRLLWGSRSDMISDVELAL